MKRLLKILVFVGLALGMFVPPASSQYQNGGYALINANLAFGSNACVFSGDYAPVPGNAGSAWYVNSTQTGTVQLFRVDYAGATHSQGAATTVTGGVEAIIYVLYPINRMRVQFCDTNSTAGTVNFEANEIRGGVL